MINKYLVNKMMPIFKFFMIIYLVILGIAVIGIYKDDIPYDKIDELLVWLSWAAMLVLYLIVHYSVSSKCKMFLIPRKDYINTFMICNFILNFIVYVLIVITCISLGATVSGIEYLYIFVSLNSFLVFTTIFLLLTMKFKTFTILFFMYPSMKNVLEPVISRIYILEKIDYIVITILSPVFTDKSGSINNELIINLFFIVISIPIIRSLVNDKKFEMYAIKDFLN